MKKAKPGKPGDAKLKGLIKGSQLSFVMTLAFLFLKSKSKNVMKEVRR